MASPDQRRTRSDSRPDIAVLEQLVSDLALLLSAHAGGLERAGDAVRRLRTPEGVHKAVIAELTEAGSAGAGTSFGQMSLAARHVVLTSFVGHQM